MQLDSDMCTVAFISCIRRDRSYDGPLLDPVKCLVSKASWLSGSPILWAAKTPTSTFCHLKVVTNGFE